MTRPATIHEIGDKSDTEYRILFLGDIVGRAARNAIQEQLPQIKSDFGIDAAIVNCENAAGGFGVTPEICDRLFEAGCDVLTTGNHVFDKGEISPYLERQNRLIRPVNMGAEFPGAGHVTITLDSGMRLAVINVMCNLFMAENANAFMVMKQLMQTIMLGRDADVIVVDVHGEATSEKMLWGIFWMGRPVWWLVPIPIYRPRIIEFWLQAQPIRQMPACVAIMIGDWHGQAGSNIALHRRAER